MWKPKEIIVHETVRGNPISKFFLNQCRQAPVKHVSNGKAKDIIAASDILKNAGRSMLDKIQAGKQVVYISPAKGAVDIFTMPDDRMV